MRTTNSGNNLSTTTIAVIVVTAVGLLLLAAVLVWLAQRTRKHQRHNKAHNIRGEAAEETQRIRQRDALADETAPRPAPPKPKPTSKRPKPPVCNSRPPPAAARHHLPRPPQRAVRPGRKLDPAAPTDETPRSTHKAPQNR
jgi:cytoskeletal protein RodZ